MAIGYRVYIQMRGFRAPMAVHAHNPSRACVHHLFSHSDIEAEAAIFHPEKIAANRGPGRGLDTDPDRGLARRSDHDADSRLFLTLHAALAVAFPVFAPLASRPFACLLALPHRKSTAFLSSFRAHFLHLSSGEVVLRVCVRRAYPDHYPFDPYPGRGQIPYPGRGQSPCPYPGLYFDLQNFVFHRTEAG